VDRTSLPQDGTGWRTSRGALGIWIPAPSLLVASLVGHGEATFTSPILNAYDSLAKTGPVHVFFDAETLTNYDTPLRTGLTQRFVIDRKRFGGFHVLVKSRIVAMGVSVANLAMGNVVRSTAERSVFKAALDSCLFQGRIRGFSSDVLELFLRRTSEAAVASR
jgi:hypothetical protein